MCSMSLTVVVSDALEQRRDAAGHLVRRQAGVLPGHRDHRHPDLGKMSVGVRIAASGPTMSSVRASTTKV
jgi:hypothetical protein